MRIINCDGKASTHALHPMNGSNETYIEQHMDERQLIIQFRDCFVVRNDSLVADHLWVRDGRIIDPESLFFDEKKQADIEVDCKGQILAPGFIDLQINGGFGYDFSDSTNHDICDAVQTVATGILAHGVTSFCPTLITQSTESYKREIGQIRKSAGTDCSTVLGCHLEGPFISRERRGAHPVQHVKSQPIESFTDVINVYGDRLDDVAIVTLAPELDQKDNVVRELSQRGIVVAVGHSESGLERGEQAVASGARLVTHLFNAMLPFHHRDPGLVGLLTSQKTRQQVYYSIIADGHHTHYAALNIAYRANPGGLVLVTDALSAMGAPSGSELRMGENRIEVKDGSAYIFGTNTLCGSITTMDQCVRNLKKFTGCSVVQAIQCASLHPAQVLGIDDRKGTLDVGSDADFVLLDHELNVKETWIAGRKVWPSFKIKT